MPVKNWLNKPNESHEHAINRLILFYANDIFCTSIKALKEWKRKAIFHMLIVLRKRRKEKQNHLIFLPFIILLLLQLPCRHITYKTDSWKIARNRNSKRWGFEQLIKNGKRKAQWLIDWNNLISYLMIYFCSNTDEKGISNFAITAKRYRMYWFHRITTNKIV